VTDGSPTWGSAGRVDRAAAVARRARRTTVRRPFSGGGASGRRGAGVYLQHDLAGSWHDLYEFTLEQYRPEDYIVANYYSSHSPDSLFVRHVICTKPTPQGRVMLLDQKLKIRTKDGTQQVAVAHPDDIRALLKAHFGIDQGEIAAGLAQRWDRRGS